MKPNYSSPLALWCCLSLGACASTETGNPTKPEDAGGAPLAGTPIEIGVGLRSSQGGAAIAGVGPRVSGLWLRVSEIDLIGCSGATSTTNQLSTPNSLSNPQSITITSTDDEVCAVVVRTEALQATDDGSVPQEAAGQGALVQGTNYGGVPFSATVPSRITAVLTPTTPGLTLAEATDLRLVVEDSFLLEVIGTPAGVQPTSPAVYDSQTAPEVVDQLANQISRAFTLVRGDTAAEETLANSVAAWAQVEDLLCTADCAQQDRLTCGQPSCDPQTCVAQLMDPTCGQMQREHLNCRVGLNLSEFTCDGTHVSALTTHCADVDDRALACWGGN